MTVLVLFFVVRLAEILGFVADTLREDEGSQHGTVSGG